MKPFNPIEHVAIIVKENQTFDNYFGTFPGANGESTLPHAPDLLPAIRRTTIPPGFGGPLVQSGSNTWKRTFLPTFPMRASSRCATTSSVRSPASQSPTT